MKIIGLKAENTKRITAIEIKPGENGNVVTLRGKNGVGKSSVIDSIFWALTGKMPDGLVKDGEDRASITLNLGEYIIKKTIPKSGPATLTIKAATGGEIKSPQKFLDNLVGSLSFDPLAFMTMPPREQRKMLIELSGLNTEQIDAEKKTALDLVNEKKFKAKHAAEAMEKWRQEDGPDISQDVPDQNILEKQLQQEKDKKQKIILAKIKLDGAHTELKKAMERLARLFGDVKDAESEVKMLSGVYEGIQKEFQGGDTSPIESNIKTIEAQIVLAKAWKTGTELHKKCTEAFQESEAAQNAVKEIDDKRKQMIADAKMPIDGLSVSEDSVLFNSRPLAVLSGAESLTVGLAMAMSLNPEIKVIRMKDAALLDSENLAIIKKLVKGKDFQIWIEQVSDDKEIKVIIEEEN